MYKSTSKLFQSFEYIAPDHYKQCVLALFETVKNVKTFSQSTKQKLKKHVIELQTQKSLDTSDVKEKVASVDAQETLIQVLNARGKKGTDRKEQIEILKSLISVSKTNTFKVRVLLVLISCQFDFSYNGVLGIELWKSNFSYLMELLDILDVSPDIVVSPLADEPIDDNLVVYKLI